MAAITPSTNLYLLKCPNNLTNTNQLTFSDATAQFNYFNSLPKLVVNDFTYQRKDYTIRYPACIDDIINYNYVMYQNKEYTNKWFYAVIENMQWINDHMTAITIKTDAYQTFMFDITFKTSFVVREHVNDDTLGTHTIPESLETGDYVINSHETDNLSSDLTVIMASTVDPNDKINVISAYNGIPCGCAYYRYDSVLGGVPMQSDMMTDINKLAGSQDAIVGMFLAPKWISGGSSTKNGLLTPTFTISTSSYYLSRMTTLNGYTPKNSKCLTYPYCYIEVSNCVGQANTYSQELWSPTSQGLLFKMDGCLTPGCSIRGYPCNYKGVTYNYDEGISLGKYPQLNWSTDHYTNWLVQNGVNIGGIKLNAEQWAHANVALGAVNALTDFQSGDALGGMESVKDAAGTMWDWMQEKYQHQLVPPTLHGSLNNGDIITSSGLNKFHFYKMSVKYEYAKCIDDYFTMYGYQVNSVKVPNITGRTYWNYVKCVAANVEGLIPEFYLDEIKSMLNNGITFWHDASKFLDYSQNNTIVST